MTPRWPEEAARRLRVPILALVLGACEEPLVPPDLAGTYALRQVNGQAVPYPLAATVTCDLGVTGGTLLLERGGGLVLDMSYDVDCTRSGGQLTHARWPLTGTYAVAGASVLFESPYVGGGARRWGGTISEGGLHVSLPPMPVPGGYGLTALFQKGP